MKDINAKTVLDEETSQFYYEGLATHTKYKDSDVATYLNELSRPNLLINGDFQVRQRGDSFDYSNSSLSKRTYTFDRWSIGVGSKNFKITYENGCRIQNTVAGAYFELANICENNLKVGDVVTLSLKIKSNNDFVLKQRIGVSSSDNPNAFINIKQGTHIYTITSIIRAEGVAINQIGVFALFGYADVLFDITVEWAKLELGSFATPFYPKSYADELSACQRYYQRTEQFTSLCVSNAQLSKSYTGTTFLVKMRALPEITNINIITSNNVNISKMYHTAKWNVNGISYIDLKERNGDCIHVNYVWLDAEIY